MLAVLEAPEGRMTPEVLREYHVRRFGVLKTERMSWDTHWREIAQYTLPRQGRWFDQDQSSRGAKKHGSIIDSSATKAARILASGMLAGASSPARPWFRLTTPEPDLNRRHSVRLWLDIVTEKTQRAMRRSNTYRMLYNAYEETGVFGTFASIMVPDFESVVRHIPLTIGEFCLQQDFYGRVDTIYREFDMSVGALVREFGFKQCSAHVQSLYNSRHYDKQVRAVHAIEPRMLRDASKRDRYNMPWASVYFEANTDAKTILREGGFRSFPVLAPRWGTASGDVYGYSPGMDTLGDNKALQHQQKRKAQAIDFKVIPPLQHPSMMKGRELNRNPGGTTPVDSVGPQNGVRSMWDVDLDLNALREDMAELRARIRENYYVDMFLMLAASDRREQTAAEVAEKHEEKLLQLGPVYERQQTELYEPLINYTVGQLLEAGALPPPPPELRGVVPHIEFMSVMAQAQRAVGAVSADRFLGTLTALANIDQDVRDVLAADEVAFGYADMFAVDPRFLRSPDEIARRREARNQALAAQQQAELMKTQGEAVRNFTAAPEQPAVQQDVLGLFSGYLSPSARAL